ncbi:MAG: LacI family DNA-binding transcriptional regulator, partial [Asticcacaulis sp.]
MKRPTSFDIAALAGVSQATVSRALSRASGVSDEVRRRVFDAAGKLNYVVDINARKLRSKKINTIAVLVSQDIDRGDNRINPFFLPLIGSILAYAAEKGIDVLMSLQKPDDDWGMDYGFSRRADGIIFLGYRDFEAYKRKVEGLRQIGEPWVVFGPVMADDPDLFVGSDNEGGAHAAVQHLLGLGRRRVVFLGEPSARHSEFFERFRGYFRAHEEAGLIPDPSLCVDCFISREEGAAAIDRLLDEGAQFDAVFAVTDLLAIGAIQSLQKRGLNVPRDVSVMGFDDLWVCTCTSPELSTVRQDTTTAAKVLLDTLGQL